MALSLVIATLVCATAPAKVYIPPMPFMPAEYGLKVSYTITREGKTTHYVDNSAYNLNATSKHLYQYRKDELVDGKVLASTVELPTTRRAAYRYNYLIKECTSYTFTSAIDGFPLLYRSAPYVMTFLKNETVQGKEANVFQYVFEHWGPKDGKRTYAVWFLKDTFEPLQVYDSTADIDHGLYTVFEFVSPPSDVSFDVPKEWSCKEPSASVGSLVV